jgi:ATP:ADP antiporter, AAA family
MSQDKISFSPWRAYLWPIHSHELSKFFPLFLMAFFIGFIYNILRNMKDTLLITAELSGAEVLPFIKVWGIVPAAFLMTLIYSRLNNRLKRDRLFYTMVSIFLVFFALFTFVIYPIREHLHPHQTADFFQACLPKGFKGMIAMFRYWTFSSFYIMSELWSATILSMVFWGFANEVTRLGEAKRVYGLIAIGINLSGVISGQVSVFLSGEFFRSHIIITENPWNQSIIFLTATVLFSGCVILGIYRYMNQFILPYEPAFKESADGPKSHKIKMSLRENFSYLGRSKYLLSIAFLVLAYNIVICLIEVIWKDQVRQLHPNPNDFNTYISQVTTVTGIISFFISLLISGQVIRKFGWTFAALLTPIILLVTCMTFFFFFFKRATLVDTLALLGTSPLALVVLFGSIQNCFSRAAKYTLFDATKEIAFIPLNRESKLKGKAAIDGVGSRLGKSGGSLIHQGLLIVFSTIAASAHIICGILLIIIAFWLTVVLYLGKQFKLLTTTGTQQTTLSEEAKEAEKKPALT